MKIYKYLNPSIFNKVFATGEFCTFKCSHPNDFNDPYELFLTIDYQQEPGALATYKEIIGELPQLPVTCFSKSPEIIPMWAHYGQNHTGFVIEIDEEKLIDTLPDFRPDDVDYQDEASDGLLDILIRAYKICKPRYAYMLQKGVFSAAYYTKKTCWSYELERRLVLKKEYTNEKDGVTLVNIPISCVTAIVAGVQVQPEIEEQLENLSVENDVRFFKLNIGKSTSKPFFTCKDNNTYLFETSEIMPCEFTCEECNEPIQEGANTCSWCSINEDDENAAAARNPLRMFHEAGILDDYYRSMGERIDTESD